MKKRDQHENQRSDQAERLHVVWVAHAGPVDDRLGQDLTPDARSPVLR